MGEHAAALTRASPEVAGRLTGSETPGKHRHIVSDRGRG